MDRIPVFLTKLFFSIILLVIGFGTGLILCVPVGILFTLGMLIYMLFHIVKRVLCFFSCCLFLWVCYVFFIQKAMMIDSFLLCLLSCSILIVAGIIGCKIGSVVMWLSDKLKGCLVVLFGLFLVPWYFQY